jgi:energy-coupling factor transporter ATP-binding protein EcfA2
LIREIELENIKGFKKVRVADLKMINFFGGKNNVGKTSILEILNIFYKRNNIMDMVKVIVRRNEDELITTEHIIDSIFYMFDTDSYPTITINCRNIGGIPDVLKFSFIRSEYDDNLMKGTLHGSKKKLLHTNNGAFGVLYNNFGNQKVQRSFRIDNGKLEIIGNTRDLKNLDLLNKMEAYNNLTHVECKMIYPSSFDNDIEILDCFSEVDRQLKKGELISYMKFIEPRLEDISISSMKGKFRLELKLEGLHKRVPINFLGQGSKRVLYLLLITMTSLNSIICIDEIENGIHYELFDKMFSLLHKICLENKVQLFVTTHNGEILPSIFRNENEVKNDIGYYRIENTNFSESIEVVSFNQEELETTIDRGWGYR